VPTMVVAVESCRASAFSADALLKKLWKSVVVVDTSLNWIVRVSLSRTSNAAMQPNASPEQIKAAVRDGILEHQQSQVATQLSELRGIYG
jgi:hypothetical protein